MTIEQLFQQTSNRPDLIWAAVGALAQAVQALAVVASGLFIILQLRQLRQESIANKIAGLKAALETIDTTVFKQVSKQALTGSDIRGVNWEELLDQISRVAILIREGYTDEQLFLSQRGVELAAISRYLRTHPGSQPDLATRFQPAWELLETADKFKQS